MVISVLHLHSGAAVTQNSKKRREFTLGPLIAMELLFEVKMWLDTEKVLLGQKSESSWREVPQSLLCPFKPQERGLEQSKTPIQNFWEGLNIRWPEKSQTFRVCVQAKFVRKMSQHFSVPCSLYPWRRNRDPFMNDSRWLRLFWIRSMKIDTLALGNSGFAQREVKVAWTFLLLWKFEENYQAPWTEAWDRTMV